MRKTSLTPCWSISGDKVAGLVQSPHSIELGLDEHSGFVVSVFIDFGEHWFEWHVVCDRLALDLWPGGKPQLRQVTPPSGALVGGAAMTILAAKRRE